MIYTLNIPNSASAQNLSVYMEDIAGNHVEGKINDFLVTTNFFILWFKNTPLFIGTIVVLIALAGGVILLILKKKNKSKP